MCTQIWGCARARLSNTTCLDVVMSARAGDSWDSWGGGALVWKETFPFLGHLPRLTLSWVTGGRRMTKPQLSRFRNRNISLKGTEQFIHSFSQRFRTCLVLRK